MRLVSELLQLLLGLVIDGRALLRLRQHLPRSLLALVIRQPLDFPLLLESVVLLASLSPCQTPRLLHGAYLATTSWYFQPNSWPSLPTVQYLRPGFSLSTRRACGTTILFLRSYGGGMPSNVFRRSIALAPRSVLCGIMPRTVRQNILEGVRKCHGPPRVGLNRVCLRRKAWYFTADDVLVKGSLFAVLAASWRYHVDLAGIRLDLKNSPEMLRASHRTTTIFWPFRSCFATVLARRPRRWPLPSMTI